MEGRLKVRGWRWRFTGRSCNVQCSRRSELDVSGDHYLQTVIALLSPNLMRRESVRNRRKPLNSSQYRLLPIELRRPVRGWPGKCCLVARQILLRPSAGQQVNFIQPKLLFSSLFAFELLPGAVAQRFHGTAVPA